MKPDYLDELIEASSKDPHFAAEWEEVDVEFRLTEARRHAGLSQEQVAAKLGVSRARVAEIERHPLAVSVRRMLDYLSAIDGNAALLSPVKPGSALKRAG